MTFKTPQFWYSTPGLKSAALTPLACLYNALRRKQKAGQQCGIPVICIGNAVAGGSGKTPTALAVMALIKSKGLASNPMFLTRGYGGSITVPTRITAEQHSAAETGDEAQLLARAAPVIVSPDRVAGAQLAKDQGADLIIMDDGYQNHSLHKDLNILVVDGETGFGNGKLLPAGPLREPAEDALKRADIIIMIGNNATNIRANKPVISGQITPDKTTSYTGRYIAFAGLARPEKFFKTLRDNGVDVIETISFPDHHAYSATDMHDLQSHAKSLNATLITTAKDAVKLPDDFNGEVFTITLTLNDKDDILTNTMAEVLS